MKYRMHKNKPRKLSDQELAQRERHAIVILMRRVLIRFTDTFRDRNDAA